LGVGSSRDQIQDFKETKRETVANIKSQKKRILQNNAAQERNKAVRSALKTKVRRFREALATGDAAKAGEALKDASRALDKAVSKGVIHKNQAANRKSALAKALNK
jgi:small subunit ribosomal protein S20